MPVRVHVERDESKVRAELKQVEADILNLEAKLERLYEQRRECVNYLGLNKARQR